MKPKTGVEYYLEKFNLYLTSIYSFCLTLITYYVPDEKLQADFGLLLIGIIIIMIVVNLIYVLSISLRE